MVDPYEGSYPKSSVIAREQHFKEMGFSQRIINTLIKRSYYARKEMYVSCSHKNLTESDAMWKLYGMVWNSSNGIAM